MDVSKSPIGQALEEQYKSAAGEAAWLELHMRLLVGAHVETKKLVPARLEEVEDAIVDMASQLNFSLSKSEIEELRKIRNKLFHCQFDSFSDLVTKRSGCQPQGAVYQLNLSNPTKEAISISNTSQKDSGIYGWMLNSLSRGDIERSKHLFISMTNKITELATISSGKILKNY